MSATEGNLEMEDFSSRGSRSRSSRSRSSRSRSSRGDSKRKAKDSSNSLKSLISKDDLTSVGETASYSTSRSRKKFVDERPARYEIRVMTWIYVGLIVGILIFGAVMPMIKASLDDGYWIRCLWWITLPPVFGMMLFPFKLAVMSTGMLLGPYRNMDTNSTNHSAIKPPVPDKLPKIFVEMPVYKEDFEETIKPSLDDIYQAIKYYRRRGGEAHMFINDDGLQLISEEDRQERIDYYNKYNIAYIARPPPKVLERWGLFKKASNMNFCLNFSLEVDQAMETLGLSRADAIDHVKDSREYPVLCGGPIGMKGIRNILLVDSDTRVPEACLYDTVGEFDICPNLGFAQHTISVLRVEDNYWEEWLADFTDKLYNLFVASGTGNGDPPPLVGHNATLSWEAMKDCSWFDEEMGYQCYWSECHVSEDFDMSMRLQSKGYTGRYIMYTGKGFMEGVSVQVFDEIIKLKKYSFGTGEMLFNKIKDWPQKGVLSDLIMRYFRSDVNWEAKMNIIAYLFTYVAMSWAIMYVPVSFYLSLLSDPDTHMQLTAYQIFCGCIAIFTIIGCSTTILFVCLRGGNSILMESLRQVCFIPIVTLFFCGLLYHIFVGMVRYLFDMKAEWGATCKELDPNMKYELHLFPGRVWETIKRFWFMYILIVLCSGGLAALFLFGPDWLNWSGVAMTPFITMLFCHAFMPIILDYTAMYCLWHPFQRLVGCRKRQGQQQEEGSQQDQDDDDDDSDSPEIPAEISARHQEPQSKEYDGIPLKMSDYPDDKEDNSADRTGRTDVDDTFRSNVDETMWP